jgi:signal transduction histidine kinase
MGPFLEMTKETRQRSLYQQIKLARFWLPLSIVGVVLLHQLVIVPRGNEMWQFWEEVLFYSILGPVVTFMTLDWIASEVKRREDAQNEMQKLNLELQENVKLLNAIQRVTEQFVSAGDLETALAAVSEGITKVTGAEGTGVFFGVGDVVVSQQYSLSKGLLQNATERNRLMAKGELLEEIISVSKQPYWVRSMPLMLAGKLEGSIHAYYIREPEEDQRESFNILASEFSAAAEATRSRTRDLLTLINVDRSIRAEGNLERLLKTLLTQMMTRADASLGEVYLADEAHLLRLLVSQGGVLYSGLAIRVGEGLIGDVATYSQPRVVNQLAPEQKGSSPLLQQASSAIALPLLSEQELLGVIVLGHEAAQHFDEASLPFLNLVAGQVSLAVRNARAYLQSEELAIAEERARIAREIHDGIAQSLAFSALKLDLVSRLIHTDSSKAEHELKETKATLREMIKELRRSIFALRPIDLERHGFIETIRRYCNDYGQQNDVTIEVEIQEVPQLTAMSEAVLFRIFQESMNNVAKHAGANQVQIHLGTTSQGQGFISIEDNGKGFDLAEVSDRVTSAGGLGLRQMQERLESRGGVFEIVTAPSEGTKVFASVPE